MQDHNASLPIPMILGIAVLIFVAVLIWRLMVTAKKNVEGIGETFNQFVLNEGELLIIVILILCYISEAMIATSLHPVSEQIIDTGARFVSHLAINFFGFVASTLATKFVIDFMLSLKYLSSDKDGKGNVIRKSNPPLVFVLFVLSSLFLFSSFIIPYYNTTIISVGLGKSNEFAFACQKTMYFWKDTNQISREFGYDPHRSTYEILGYNMFCSFVVFIAHVLGSVAEGFLASLNSLIHGKRGYVGRYEDHLKKLKEDKKPEDKDKAKESKPDLKSESKPDPKSPEDKTKEKEKKELSLYRNILSVFNQKEDWVTSMVNKIQSSYATMDLDEMQTVNSTLNDMNLAIQQAKKKRNSDEYTENEYQSTLSDIRSEIRVFIEKPKPEGLEVNLELED